MDQLQLKAIVAQKHLLKHPFYQLWLQGKLPKQALQQYSQQYFQLVAHLPRFISTLHTNCDDEITRKQLTLNLMEEELGYGNGNIPHTTLWLDFAQELGVENDQVKNASILPATQNAINTMQEACQSSPQEGAAALYAYESQAPEISEEKITALKEQYDMHSDKALRFFTVHAQADIKHRAVWTALTKRYAQTQLQRQQAEIAATKTRDALWHLFDAMYDQFVPNEIKTMC